MIRTPVRAGGLLLVAVLVLSGCGSDDPSAVLQSAVERTFERSFAYELSIQADRDALAALGEGAGQAAAFLSGFGIDGRVDGDSSVVRVRAMGLDALEVRVVSPEEMYVRLGVRDLAAFAGESLGDEQLVASLRELDMPDSIVAGVVALADGGWVLVDGPFPMDRIRELVAPGEVSGEEGPEEDVEDTIDEAFGADIAGFLDRFVVVEEVRDEDGQDRYAVALRLHELLRTSAELNQQVAPGSGAPLADLETDLQALPEEVDGAVDVRDGVVTRITFDITGGGATGTVALDLQIDQHGSVGAVTAPEDPVVVPADDLAGAIGRLLDFTGGLLPAA